MSPVWSPVCSIGLKNLLGRMEMSEAQDKEKQIGKEEEEVEEEEYVLLELDDCLYSDISPGAPFVLSGLDTLTPTLAVGDGLKMIGEYEETVGTCYLFSESEPEPKPSAEMPPSGENKYKPASSSNEAPSKELMRIISSEERISIRTGKSETILVAELVLFNVDNVEGMISEHQKSEAAKWI
ncbi:hypothetical protein EJB05_38610 [Eragrostis curvula]|uniref:Transcription factor TFIIIC triple barrel domain-containing protein n=1 Tax=Eragrostis curvula TaxID=38414 RepID=A0A5J9TW93_9POAL|nr:hypothetical protein EJB05_38610 [Eragrostis curvula]